jgi:hypothetical protein
MRHSAAWYLRPGKPVKAATGVQAASLWLAALTGGLVLLNRNRYSIIAVRGSHRDPGRRKVEHGEGCRGVLTELPGSTGLGPGAGLWHQIPAGGQILRANRRLLDLQISDAARTPA